MSKKVRIILNVILGLVLIAGIVGLVFWSIHCWELEHNMFLKEYTAQMDKFGYYKKDIKLFDQSLEQARYFGSLTANVCCWIVVGSTLLAHTICGVCDRFAAFKFKY